MRRILIDHARAKRTVKRGQGRRGLPLDAVDLARHDDPGEILSVDEALSRLEVQDVRLAEIVRLRFFAGLSEAEIAALLGVTERTVRRDWVLARAWLTRALSEE
jgi:RNA polymerase sigma factor (TIGR02999 family)